MTDLTSPQSPQSPTQTIGSAWAKALIKFTDLDKAEAKRLGKILGAALPIPPGPESLSFISHELLVDLGIEDPGARARCILAAARAPPPETTSDDRRSDALASIEFDSNSIDTNIVNVQTFTKKGPASDEDENNNAVFSWTDISGQDCAPPDQGTTPIPDDWKNSKFLAACKAVQAQIHPGSVPIDQIQKGDRNSKWSIIYAKKPLPVLIKDQDKSKRRGSVILRVCTLDVSPDSADSDIAGTGEEVTMTSLTNRLMLFVDADNFKIATVHRVDNRAIHHLRESFAPTVNANGPDDKEMEPVNVEGEEEIKTSEETFKETLVSIFMCFQSEFLLALEEAKSFLDESEQLIMDRKLAHANLSRLHNLSRRASVYNRMLELSERVVRDACDYFDVEGEAAILEERWSQIRDECSALNDRSMNALNLIIALAGYRTSDAVTILTKISGALALPMFISGYYGQNFSLMPELNWKYSYFVANIFMICSIVIVLIFLKRMGL